MLYLVLTLVAFASTATSTHWERYDYDDFFKVARQGKLIFLFFRMKIKHCHSIKSYQDIYNQILVM